jgi:PAS domain S-box-containing protein
MEEIQMQNSQSDLYYFVFNHVQECVVGYDRKGDINYCNDRIVELTGYSKDELKGMYIGKLFKNTFEVVDNQIRLAENINDDIYIKTNLYRKNMTCFPVKINISSIKYDNNEELYVCTAVDMTVYKQSIMKLEETTMQMQESMKERDAFVANVTHELRTPVNGIKGNAELLMEQEQDFQKSNNIKMILDCCTTMEGIINNILDFSKLEAGKFQLDEKPFSFYDLMSKLEKMFAMITARKGLRFMMNISQDIPDALIGDELRITQILNNLVSNAVKFTAQGYVGVEITLNQSMSDEVELFFMVVDTGIGLSTSDKEKLFKSFSQVDASITRKYGGTGLGLSITKELVGMMHGRIWADGEKGKGSNFSFTLRLKLQKTQEQNTDKPNITTWKTSNKIKNAAAEQDLMYEFGSDINKREIKKYFEKLNLSMDLENWQKAESFATTLKQLMKGGSKELGRVVFKMEMVIRKSDCEKAREYETKVKELLAEELGYGC